MDDPYAGWRESLKGGPLKLSAGRFRHKRTGQPVAIFPDPGGNLVYMIGNEPHRYVDDRWEENYFSYCDAVSEEAYILATQTGAWPDHLRVGDNRPEGIDEVREEIARLRDVASAMILRGPAKTEEEAHAASNLRARVEGLHNQLRTALASESAPIQAEINKIEQQKRPWQDKLADLVDSFQRPFRDAADTVAKLKEIVLKPYLQAKRREQEKAGQVQNLRGGGTKPVPTNVGATGSKTKLMTRWFAVIEDWDAAIAALKENTKLRATVQDIADAAARSSAKIAIPGVKFEKKEDVQ